MIYWTLFPRKRSVYMNKLKQKCKLLVGDSFVYKAEYCMVIGFRFRHFIYTIQGKPKVTGYMFYTHYLKTPSAKGRKILS